MEGFIITGGTKLSGKVELSGAKNAALPILAASLLADNVVVLDNVPLLMEGIKVMIEIISLGVNVNVEERKVFIMPDKITKFILGGFYKIEDVYRDRASKYNKG